MGNPNPQTLVLKLKFVGETQFQMRVATRIKLDGTGKILFWDADTGAVEEIDLAVLDGFLIVRVVPSSQAA